MMLACAGSAFLHGLLEPMPDHSSVLADFPVQLETLLQTKIHRRAILTASSVFFSFGDESRATGNSVPFFTTNEARQEVALESIPLCEIETTVDSKISDPLSECSVANCKFVRLELMGESIAEPSGAKEFLSVLPFFSITVTK